MKNLLNERYMKEGYLKARSVDEGSTEEISMEKRSIEERQMQERPMAERSIDERSIERESAEECFKILVECFKNGDKAAGEELVTRLKPLIYSSISRYGWGLEREELFQEACISILEAAHLYNPDRGVPFLAYIKIKVKFHIYNKAKLQRKRESRAASCVDDNGNSIISTIPDPDAEIDSELLLAEELEHLTHAFSGLNEMQKTVITLYYYEKFTLTEIAEALGVSYKTAYRIKSKAIKRMREIFD